MPAGGSGALTDAEVAAHAAEALEFAAWLLTDAQVAAADTPHRRRQPRARSRRARGPPPAPSPTGGAPRAAAHPDRKAPAPMALLTQFRWALGATAVLLAAAWAYGGAAALAVAAILAVLEVSLSFDNAVVNAGTLRTMSPRWQRLFLTVGILIAVFGMRLLFPLLIVGITAGLGPGEVFSLALDKGDPNTPGSYGYLLSQAHPQIAAFGGAFLLALFFTFLFEDKELTWLSWLERPLARAGKLDYLPVMATLAVLLAVAAWFSDGHGPTVMTAGVLGLLTYLAVSGLGNLFSHTAEDGAPTGGGTAPAAVGKQAFFLFCYLEVLDASFSFDGVIGAFAITPDPILIMIGLGIGAMYIRSATVYLVRQGTLDTYEFLEHGAMWAIGALAALLLAGLTVEVPEALTGAVGLAFIVAAVASSVARTRRLAAGVRPAA